jgi:MOSC domain-containing protein YiiM
VDALGQVLSVNIGQPRRMAGATAGVTGIDKRPIAGRIVVRAPAAKGVGGSGVDGDAVCDLGHHGGPDQAVYAYAIEDLARWSAELRRPLAPGTFGENLTLADVDVTGARLGERWRVGGALLEVRAPRIPCRTFARWLGATDWIARFIEGGAPGAYLRVLVAGEVGAGDPVEVVHRPEHDVSVGLALRALTSEPERLPALLRAGDALPAETRARVVRAVGPAPTRP